MADSGMDEFAQTRGADDLFDDEIIPVSAEEQQVQTEVVVPEEVAPAPQVQEESPRVEKTASPRGETPQRGRGSERGRGRGRGRGKGGRGGRESQPVEQKRAESVPRKNGAAKSGLEGSRWATAEGSSEKPQEVEKEKVREQEQEQEQAKEKDQDQPAEEEESKAEVASADGTEAARVPAVRGDRSATGGVRKPKLTEEELSKRIAAAKENAVKKAAAHARAQADQASFMEREQIAAKKRREELANRRVMDNEREQNRQRKLKAQTGREWDSQKREEDYNPRGGGSQFRRGMHGGVSGHTRKDFDAAPSEEAAEDLLSPNRGQRASSREPSEKSSSPAVKKEDFPALPAGKKPEDDPKPAAAPLEKPSMEKLEATMSPVTGTWADQFDDDE
ncbi:hypothetical protein N7509_010427 [Penicillium cosmopolitanum]|uniref:Uncharacterized protein n=1 Tax=Penicillium cosmopolitanum TaxID=1131564 RepID=A0A9W9VR88_9EURO|nr:uncharacterized protein N7509_010427 [Penicillium cosmopolitanum]KAJ5387886.1 hypothetical protein N7509_010427 [Penicillium cosmopolitanum]